METWGVKCQEDFSEKSPVKTNLLRLLIIFCTVLILGCPKNILHICANLKYAQFKKKLQLGTMQNYYEDYMRIVSSKALLRWYSDCWSELSRTSLEQDLSLYYSRGDCLGGFYGISILVGYKITNSVHTHTHTYIYIYIYI